MIKKIAIPLFILLLGLHFQAFSQGSWRPGEMEVKVRISDPGEATALGNLDFNGDIYTSSGYALLYLIPRELDILKQSGFSYEILKSDLNAYSKDFWKSRDQYHTYDEIIQVMDSLSTTYPSFCKKFNFGLSVEGRELCALKISDNVNADEPEPEVMFDGGIHGDEVGGPENLVRFAMFLCDSYYNNDPDITALVNSREIWLYMMVNPDGRVNMIRYNSNGVDLNRDWGYMWNGEGSSPDYYSQVETRALRSCQQSNQFAVHITYHSGTVFLAYPWSYSPDPCPDQTHIAYLGNLYVSNSGYEYMPVEQGYTGMYEISGSSKDANYGGMGSVSWTLELSSNKQPPASQIQYYYDINQPAMLAVLENAGFGISGTVTDANLGFPVAATIFVNDYLPCYNDPVIGDYHKYLLAGEYTVTAVANGYQPMTQTVTVGDSSTATLNFVLQQQYTRYAYRVIACRRPIANFEDECRTSAALWAPDGVNYSLGKFGWIILDMQDEILDGPGNEIIIHEGDNDPEGYACYVSESMDGPWQLAGNGTGTTTFNLGASGLTSARFIRIEDDGDGDAYGDNTGFDLDAVEIPEQPEIIYLVLDCSIDDPSGNNNHRADPGENFDLVISLSNFGNLLMDGGQAYLNIDPQFINVTNPEQAIADLDYGESTQLVFHMTCSSFCPLEELLMTVLNITSNEGAFQQSFPINFTAGAIIEDWETSNFSKFDWSTGGNKNWAISFLDPYEGNCCAKSGNVNDGQSTYLQVSMDVIGYDDISFYRKVSSEPGSDYLSFYIDNNLIGNWSGEFGWEYMNYQVAPGTHTFKWTFTKDNLNSQGSDAGWIDYIVFPSCNLDGELKVLANANPHEFCGAQETQLGAYVLGNNGNLSFNWQPAVLLTDPASQFPLAQVEESTQFTVEVSNGLNTVSSSVNVDILPVPATPVIIQQGDSLISPVSDGNQWYAIAGPVPGGNGQVFYPGSEGDYYLIITNEYGCSSGPSNIIHFIFTSVADREDQANIILYPNPVNNNLNLRFKHLPEKNILIKIFDLTGKEIKEYYMDNSDLQEFITINTSSFKKCLYLLMVMDDEGQILFSRKIVKL